MIYRRHHASASLAAAAATAAHDVAGRRAVGRCVPIVAGDHRDDRRLAGRLYGDSIAAARAQDGAAAVAAGIAAGRAAAQAMLPAARKRWAASGRSGSRVGRSPASGGRRATRTTPQVRATRSPGWPESSRSCSRARRSSGQRDPTRSTSGAYAKEYNEVKRLGEHSAARVPPSREAVARLLQHVPPSGDVQPHVPRDLRRPKG